MENIRQAIERVKARTKQQSPLSPEISRQQMGLGLGQTYGSNAATKDFELDLAYLQSQRIVSYDGRDPRSRPFDILRTEVLREMDLNGWKILAITSPTPGCGKTLTAIRSEERRVGKECR